MSSSERRPDADPAIRPPALEGPEGLRTGDFDYDLPPDRIAQRPAPRRDESRLLVLDRAHEGCVHRLFRDLPEHISPGDVLVLNETRVFPARLRGTVRGRRVEALLVRPDEGEGVWLAMLRPGRRLRAGDRIETAGEIVVEVLAGAVDEPGLRRIRLCAPGPALEALETEGEMPLPPYIRREADEDDRRRYQTVYARVPGAVAAPTAGLHFTPELLERIAASGARIVRGVLHVGPGTFRPVQEEDPRRHRMDGERYEWTPEAAGAVNEAIAAGRRVIAVGTTMARLLETVAAPEGRRVTSGSGWTDLFILPPHPFRIVDALVTNFHLPRSTLLMLVAAFAGRERILAAYAEAVREEYRFYSYGDAMLIL